jgi:hypothetical protein
MSVKATIRDFHFSQNLFWDVDASALNMEENKRFIIQRVLEYGIRSDWEIIKKSYGINTIAEEMQKVRTLERTSLSFISAITNIPVKKFKCYTSKQQKAPHWNF